MPIARSVSRTARTLVGVSVLMLLPPLPAREPDTPLRPTRQLGPVLTAELRALAPATVHLVFVVGVDGDVTSAQVESSSDPHFERAALDAVRQWAFTPASVDGQRVPARLRVPITFPAPRRPDGGR